MTVLNRKLFTDRSARKKLSEMGGIMSSSRELMDAVRTYADGGFVGAGVPTPVTVDFYGLPYTVYPDGTVRDMRGAEVDPNNASNRRLYSEIIKKAQGSAPAVEEGPADEDAAWMEEQARISAEEAAALREDMGITTSLQTPEDVEAAAAAAAAELPPPGGPLEYGPPTRPTVSPGAPDLEYGPPSRPRRNPPPAGGSPEVGGPTGGGPSDDDLRSQFEDRYDLLKSIFGDDKLSEEDRRRQLAMMFLAIAAGQSPNALTNIASGALTGVQAMDASERARREANRGLRSTALESVVAERSAAAQLAADMEAARVKMAHEIKLQEMRGAGGDTSWGSDATASEIYTESGKTYDTVMRSLVSDEYGGLVSPEQQMRIFDLNGVMYTLDENGMPVPEAKTDYQNRLAAAALAAVKSGYVPTSGGAEIPSSTEGGVTDIAAKAVVLPISAASVEEAEALVDEWARNNQDALKSGQTIVVKVNGEDQEFTYHSN